MVEKNIEESKLKESYEVSLKLRNFEIDLFWKRALFFWGFIASAFWGFIEVKTKYPEFAPLVAGFGIICSLCWLLTNRGSKRWHENWEQNWEKYGKEGGFIDESIYKSVEIENKGLLGASKYSPSKLSILLSYFVLVLWVIVFINEVVVVFIQSAGHNSCCICLSDVRTLMTIISITITVIWIHFALICAKSSKQDK